MDQITLKNLVKTFVKSFALLISESSLYPPLHPNVIAQTKQTIAAAEAVFEQLENIYIDLMEGQFAFEGIPLYEIKHITEKAAQLFASKQIRCLCFKRGLAPSDFTHIVSLLLDKTLALEAEGFQKELGKRGISKIFIEKTRAAETSEELAKISPPDKVYGSSIEANKLIYNVLQSGNTLPMEIIDKVAKNITTMIAQDRLSGIALASLRNYDAYTYTHSANVAILSVALAASIFEDAELLNHLAKAALLHDIGKTRIPLQILNKPEKLNDDEWLIMQQHPIIGAKILEQQESVDKLSIFIAMQHHMKYDLSGYPKIKGINCLHPLCLIINICDIYDAITGKRTYKKALAQDKALAIMMRLIGCDFDPNFFKLFTQMMGVFPPGGFVRLNTMELAVIRKTYPQALLLPEIKIIIDATGEFLQQPITIRLSNKEENKAGREIEEMVDPLDFGIDPLKFI